MKASILACSLLALAACTQPAREGGGGAESAPSAAAPANSTPASAEVPRQRTGLWRITATLPGVGPQSMDLCVTPEMVGQGPAVGPSAQGGDCTTPRFTRDGDAWVARSTCGAGEGRTETVVRTTGDFQTSMQSEIEMRAGGATAMRMTSTGTYVGPCPGA